MTSVACVGAGNVGRAWAIVFARAGYSVKLYDQVSSVVESQALPMIARNLEDMQAMGLIADAAAALQRISAASTLAAAVSDVEYVQESVKEDLEIKTAVYGELDRLADESIILASSTSAIPGSAFTENLRGRHRCLVVHPVNPPYLIPLVELCAAPWTAQDTVDRARRLMTEVGQTPITVTREIAGFILNRLQVALIGEALHLVAEGYCSVDDIDKTITDGLARRWAFIGPFEVGHLNATAGYRHFMQNYADMFRTLARSARVDYPWDDALIDSIHDRLSVRTPVENVPERQAWRDQRLMALAKHLQIAAQTYGQ